MQIPPVLQPFPRAIPLVLFMAFLASCGGGAEPAGSQDGSSEQVVLTSVTPPAGQVQGGLRVTLGGSGFLAGGNMQVFFADVPAGDVMILDDETVTCVVPAYPLDGPVTVRAQNAAGASSLIGGFSYHRLPIMDFNDDGVADLAVGATGNGAFDGGAAYLFFGDGVAVRDANAGEAGLKLFGIGSMSGFGHRLAAGDVTGDGITDLVVSAPMHGAGGAVFIFFGPLVGTGSLSASSADVVLLANGIQSGDFFGESLTVGDLNGDAIDDIVVGAVHHDLPFADCGAVFVFFGTPSLPSGDASSADLKLTGPAGLNRFGRNLAMGDVSGDGQTDLLIGSPHAGGVHGAVDVLFGGPGLLSGAAVVSDMTIRGEAPSDLFGSAIGAADVNGDAVPDILVGASGNDALGSSSGAAYVFFGGPARPSSATQADAIMLGSNAGDEFGRGLAGGDIDGDGIADLIVGAQGVDAGATNNGRVYAFLGRPGLGDSVAGSAAMMLTGLAITNENFGQTIELIDVDCDGELDICVGSFRVGAGDVHVFLGDGVMADLLASQDSATFTGQVGGDTFGIGLAAPR